MSAAVTNLSILTEVERDTMECLLEFVDIQIPEGNNGVWGQSPHESGGGWLGAKTASCFLAWLPALNPPEEAELLAVWLLHLYKREMLVAGWVMCALAAHCQIRGQGTNVPRPNATDVQGVGRMSTLNCWAIGFLGINTNGKYRVERKHFT